MTELNKSLERAISIINQIAVENAVGVRELSRITGCSLTQTEKIVKTLEEHKYVDKDESGKIVLGRELYYLGKLVESRVDAIQIMLQEIQDLVKDIDETVYICQRRNKHTVFIEGIQSSHAIQYVPVMGTPYDLPYGATGKAFMAFMKEEEVLDMLNFYQIEPDKILAQLPDIRKNGYSTSIQERFEGLAGIAFPLVGKDGSASFVLDIAIPTYRYSDEKGEYIIQRTKKTVDKLLTIAN
ncbi:IclR family transcriptional regulator [Neobacillus niacini]|uniref:IclR family transcriptional regulator n=1 Tax=Neobacillus niacini TaxID=86668 RepID=UPI0021CB0797|nr:IclR family transcriptional regulator [Neobacillus niacini]MCM3766212.1 IclR family transcriptional regulator [Neobacillus niacini]